MRFSAGDLDLSSFVTLEKRCKGMKIFSNDKIHKKAKGQERHEMVCINSTLPLCLK